jgi:hypothetical protein
MKEHFQYLSIFIGNGKAKGSKRRNASLAGGPFFQVVYNVTAMIEVG